MFPQSFGLKKTFNDPTVGEIYVTDPSVGKTEEAQEQVQSFFSLKEKEKEWRKRRRRNRWKEKEDLDEEVEE